MTYTGGHLHKLTVLEIDISIIIIVTVHVICNVILDVVCAVVVMFLEST
jgi:hypothetical protein